MARSPRVRGVPRPWAALSNPFGVVAQGPDPHKAQVVTDPGSVRGKEVPICVDTNGLIPAGRSALDRRAHPAGGDQPGSTPTLAYGFLDVRLTASFHIIQQMAELVFLGLEIPFVFEIRGDLDRHAFDTAKPIAVQPNDFGGVIRQEANLPDSQIK